MRITAIRTTEQGYKLIAARSILNLGGRYYSSGPVKFFNYKDNELRGFSGDSYHVMFCDSFKAALKAIMSDKLDSLIQIL